MHVAVAHVYGVQVLSVSRLNHERNYFMSVSIKR